jgi:hypothetical protein
MDQFKVETSVFIKKLTEKLGNAEHDKALLELQVEQLLAEIKKYKPEDADRKDGDNIS